MIWRQSEQATGRRGGITLKTVLGIISVIGSIAYGLTVILMYQTGMFEIPHFKAAFIGFIAGAVLWLVLGRRLNFFGVFEHELTHLVFSLLMFQKPSSFYASERRGHVACDRGNFIDGLAPYFFPTFSYVLLALYPLLKPSAHGVFFPLLGFLTGYHIISNIAEFKPRESDIRKCGTLFSFVFCLFAGIVTFGFLLAFVIGGFGGGLRFLLTGVIQVGTMVLFVAGSIQNLISGPSTPP
ncbi:MAG: hypothetical protein ABIJ00_12130 [Candidatus Eisenbacteria bacterium]